MEIVLNERLVPGEPKRFAFVEMDADSIDGDEPGLTRFLKDTSLCGEISAEEIEFLRSHRFRGMRPGPLYYYRALQILRDPLHFKP